MQALYKILWMSVCCSGPSTPADFERRQPDVIIFEAAAAPSLWLQARRWCQWKPLVKGRISHNAEEALGRGGCELEVGWRRASPASLLLLRRGRAGCVSSSSGVGKALSTSLTAACWSFASLEGITNRHELWNLLAVSLLVFFFYSS